MSDEPSWTICRAFIVDDHPLVRTAITSLLDATGDLVSCGEAGDAEDALAGIEQARPDLVALDLTLPGVGGLELLRCVRTRCPKARVLVVSMLDETFYAERAIAQGAAGFISKSEPPEELLRALRMVRDGDTYASADVRQRMLQRFAGGGARRNGPAASLTDRERAVLELIGAGLSARQIARRLGIRPKTTDAHRQHIRTKLCLPDAAALNRYALAWVREMGAPSTQPRD